MTASDNCLNLIKEFEGCNLTAYQDQGGVWTIGYGHTGPEARPTSTITQEEADALLAADVDRVSHGVSAVVSSAITQNEFDACVSLAFNIGVFAFAKSTLVQMFNKQMYAEAAQQFLVWDKVKGMVNPGLQARRQKEQALFLS